VFAGGKISDVVQGDVLRAQTLGQLEERHEEDEDEGEEAPPHAARPHSPRARQARRAMIPLVWSRVVRLAMMQCVEGYFVTGAVRSGRFCETLRARRLSDHLPVVSKARARTRARCRRALRAGLGRDARLAGRAGGVRQVIKRFAPGAGRTMATLRSFALGAWSARHPCFAAPIDAFVSCSARRPLGGARARRRVLRGEERSEALVVVSAEQASNLQALLEERIRARTMITSKEAVGWVKQLLSCLVHLHTAWRVAHRNIKLSNVLLDEHLNAYLSDVAMPRTDPAGACPRAPASPRNPARPAARLTRGGCGAPRSDGVPHAEHVRGVLLAAAVASAAERLLRAGRLHARRGLGEGRHVGARVRDHGAGDAEAGGGPRGGGRPHALQPQLRRGGAGSWRDVHQGARARRAVRAAARRGARAPPELLRGPLEAAQGPLSCPAPPRRRPARACAPPRGRPRG